MDKKESLKKKLKLFKTKVNKDYTVNKLIFFGSRASGKPSKFSDVDLIIVSSKFKNMDFIQRGAKMYNYWEINMPVDFLCYSPEEFKKLSKQPTIVHEAIKNGVVI